MKGPPLVHTLYVHNDRRIEGLVFITLPAWLVRAILARRCRQQEMALSEERLWRGFASLQAVDVVWCDGCRQRRATAMDAFQTQVLEVARL